MNHDTYVERVSRCCHERVFHPKPIGSRKLSDALAVACTECGKETTIVLIDLSGKVVWETPVGDNEI